MKKSIVAIMAIGLVFGFSSAAQADKTWDAEVDEGGAPANNNWSTGANWVGDGPPLKDGTEAVTFADAGTAGEGVSTNTVDDSWSVKGLTFANTTGKYHTTDLGANTLTVGGNMYVGYNVAGSDVTFKNGTLVVGEDGTPVDLIIGYGKVGASLAVTGRFTGNLNTVTLGYGGRNEDASGVFDLRNATPTQSTFKATTLDIGYGVQDGVKFGTVNLNDTGGVIDALEVTDNLRLGHAVLTMKDKADVTIGYNGHLANLTVGHSDWGGGDFTTEFAPTGKFTAYLNNVVVARGNSEHVATGCTGVFDLSGATIPDDQSTFKATTLQIGCAQKGYMFGTVNLNDTGGVIDALEVTDSLRLGHGVLTMKDKADVTIGKSETERGDLTVGYGYAAGTFTTTFAPTGEFTAYLNDVVVGYGKWSTDVTGVLDLRNATISTFDVSGTMSIGLTDGGRGTVYLSSGDAYADSLLIGSTSTTGNLLQLEGTELMVGDDGADTFDIVLGKGSILFNAYGSKLSVFGVEESVLNAMIDNEQLTVGPGFTPDELSVYCDGEYTHVTLAVPVPEPAGLGLMGLALLAIRRKRS